MNRIRKPIRLVVALIVVLSLTILMLPMASPVMALSPYIVYVDDDYNASTPGWGETHFNSIQDGVDAVITNGEVHVAAGIYNENIIIEKPIHLIGAGWDVVTVYSPADYVFHIASNGVSISGFYIHGGYWSGIYLDGVHGCYIYDNYLEYNWDGIEMEHSFFNTIRNNRIWYNDCDGIWMRYSSYNQIYDNDIAYNYDYSCPFVYSWDGQEYIFDSQLLNNAPKEEAEKTDYANLKHLEPASEEYLLRLTNELEETVYINELELITVDHPIGTQIVPDSEGTIHNIQSPYSPISAKDLDGTPCLNEVNAQDEVYWTSDMDTKDFSGDEDLLDGIILRFDKPGVATTAKIVVNYKNTDLPEFIHAHFGRLPEVDPVEHGKLRALLHFLKLRVWDGTQWVSKGSFHNNPGAWVARDNLISIDVSGIAGPILRIKITSLTGLVLIDSVLVDYADKVIIPDPPLSVTTAVDGDGADIVSEIQDDDDDYFVMEQGDYASLTFDEPSAIPADHDRSYVVKAKGYYNTPALAPLEGEIPEQLMEQFLADFDYAMRHHLEKYRPSHCGIYIDQDSDSNRIRGNEIHENYEEGIYLWYADSNDIIDNNIWGNQARGIHLDYSNSNEIQCNDIYDNGGWWRNDKYTGIRLGWNSWDNVINYNNIFNNYNKGVHNNNTSQDVDATNNWWGCVEGPGSSGCDTVSDYVFYAPWLAERCVDCPFDEELPPSLPPSQRPEPGDTVGGEVYLTNKVTLLAPWITLGVVILAGGVYLIRRRVHS